VQRQTKGRQVVLGEECWHTEACLTHFLVETLACQSISLIDELA
jgi:hypothetical protein